MLLPQMLREELDRQKKEAKIGFFLHTPFPSSSEFCKLPYREIILEGLLRADLIGFHTYDYARHFLSACFKALHVSTTPNCVKFKDKTVHVGAFPIGIDPEAQINGVKKDAVMKLVSGRRAKFYEDKSIIVSVDRLDYIKGLPHKFHAFDQFLEQNPDKVGKVVLIQIAVPSRQGVQEYQSLCSHISELAGRINAKFGNVDYTPLVYRFCSVPFDELLSLYAMADVCLVTSTRDGMNLVAYEYIACQAKNHGSLVISEFAGAAQSMKGCIVINPWDARDIMDGLKKALEMKPKQKEINWRKMNEHVMKFTSAHWGQSFIEELSRISAAEAARQARLRQQSTDSDVSGHGIGM
jgi:trehalose 6-phosphate synthase